MALFKILRGPSSGLENLPINDGWCYFTPDTGLFYIDYDGQRVPLNADDAKTLLGASLADTFDSSKTDAELEIEIPTNKVLKMVYNALNNAITNVQAKIPTIQLCRWEEND